MIKKYNTYNNNKHITTTYLKTTIHQDVVECHLTPPPKSQIPSFVASLETNEFCKNRIHNVKTWEWRVYISRSTTVQQNEKKTLRRRGGGHVFTSTQILHFTSLDDEFCKNRIHNVKIMGMESILSRSTSTRHSTGKILGKRFER